MAHKTFHYFAYGSNMLTCRLKAPDRAPSAEFVDTGYTASRRLTFDKRSRDGSGKCDAEETGNETDRVYGVVFEIDCSHKTALDRAEGRGKGYELETVEVITKHSTVRARTYVATRKERGLRPYHWYKALVVAGAVEHELPIGYVEWLRVFESKEDPHADRRAENEAILFAG